MATQETTSAPGLDNDERITRTVLAGEACAEIEALCSVLIRELQGVGPEDYGLRGLVLRIKALNSVSLSVLGDDDNRETADMHQVVYGTRPEAEHV
jgi:hypothetical protein